MKLFRRTLTLVGLFLAGACDRSKAPPPPDSATVKPAGNTDSVATAESRNWNPNVGPVLLVAADAPTRAFIIAPDSATASATLASIPHPASVTLFSRSGSVQTAELPSVADTGPCVVANLRAAPPPRTWNVGFIGGVVSPLPLDTTEALAHNDSSSLVVWMNRLASALPNDSAGRFSGLPFVVRYIWRFNVPAGAQFVVANLSRQINAEATPLQESTFLIAERSATDTTFATAYNERTYGPEETIQTRDVLAAALLGPNRNPALILGRDFGDATGYGLVERGDDGKWRARWSSRPRRCN
jgi:hypothetical protein